MHACETGCVNSMFFGGFKRKHDLACRLLHKNLSAVSLDIQEKSDMKLKRPCGRLNT